MSRLVDMRSVVERFAELKRTAERHVRGSSHAHDTDLHDAAMRYAAAVRRVARPKRDG